MISYEDIFSRHRGRPLSYLSSSLDSPAARRRTAVVIRSPVPHKDVRRPRSISTLDSLLRYFPPLSLESNIRHISSSSVDSKPRHILPALDCKPRPVSSSMDSKPRHISSSLDFKPRHISPSLDSNTRTVSKPSYDRIPDSYCDNYRHATTFADRRLTRRAVTLCTPDDLLDIIRLPSGYYELPTDPWNEVYPDIYLSDAPTALCTSVLKRIGVTHVLNAAQGKEKGCGQVNTWSGFYTQSGIEFLGVPAFDNVVFRLYPYFEESAQFIEDGLKSKGKVLVHCRAGISRSATLVCAFLMLRRGLTAQEAVKAVRKNRAIIPNDGFLQQLCDLNDRLKKKP